MDRFQILKPVPRHRLPRDGPRLLDSSTLENQLGSANLSQEALEDYQESGNNLFVAGHPFLLFLIGSELTSGRPEEGSRG